MMMRAHEHILVVKWMKAMKSEDNPQITSLPSRPFGEYSLLASRPFGERNQGSFTGEQKRSTAA